MIFLFFKILNIQYTIHKKIMNYIFGNGCQFEESSSHDCANKLFNEHGEHLNTNNGVVKKCKICGYVGLHKVLLAVHGFNSSVVVWKHNEFYNNNESKDIEQRVNEIYETCNKLNSNNNETNDRENPITEQSETEQNTDVENLEKDTDEKIEIIEKDISDHLWSMFSYRGPTFQLDSNDNGNKAGSCGGSNLGGHLSEVIMDAMMKTTKGIRVVIPGKRGIAWKLTTSLLESNKPPYFPHCFENLSFVKMGTREERTINLVEYLDEELNNIKRVSKLLKMPKLLEYDQEIIDAAMNKYITHYINYKFKSGKLRGKKKFNDELNLILNQLNGLDKWLDEVEKYKNRVETAVNDAKKKGETERKVKREKAAERKRIREEKKSTDNNEKQNKKQKFNP